MKIAVITTSRNRPAGLVTVVNALEALRAKKAGHEVRYFIRLDDDDFASPHAIRFLPEGTKPIFGPRTATLGQSWNDALDESMKWDWDAVTFFPDDVIPLTPHWDECFRILIEDQKIPGCCWTDASDPQQPSYFILTRKYLEALGGRTSTEFFPFWFDDTWVSEVHKLAFGTKIPIVSDMFIGGFNGATTSMWDLKFWTEFWIATRVLRIAQAQKLRQAFNAPEPDMQPIMSLLHELDKAWDLPVGGYATRIERIEAERGEKGPRTPRYLEAKERAEDWLACNAKVAPTNVQAGSPVRSAARPGVFGRIRSAISV